jgi:hypothetical protein
MEVFRIGDNIIDVDGLKVYKPNGSEFWFSFTKNPIGTIRLQALYLYLYQEERDEEKRFNVYLKNTIKKLIYKKDEH